MDKPRVFRDPVHGLVRLGGADAALGRVLDTRAVQRLRRIRQMGFASLVYPGAEHSRFGHALGAYHVAARVADSLGLRDEVARDVKAAALLHDIGHGPFSHAWELALGGGSHEAWGRRIVAEDRELRAALAGVAANLPEALDGLFGGTYRPGFAAKLISSQLDVDRMDYLLRDAHYAGVGYSAYDLDWVIHALRIEAVRTGDDPEDLVIDYRRGMNAVEQYLFGRFYMYAQVYYHKTVRAAEWMFLKALQRFADLAKDGRAPAGLPTAARMARGEEVSVEDYLGLDDAHLSCALDAWAAGADSVLRDLSARLVARHLFKTVEAGDDPAVAARLEPRLREIARARLGEHADSYWAIDRAERLGYDPRAGAELFVVGHPRLGTVDLGSLLEEFPLGREVHTVRVVCAPELHRAFADVVATETAP
jgi:uncharacterized protein